MTHIYVYSCTPENSRRSLTFPIFALEVEGELKKVAKCSRQ